MKTGPSSKRQATVSPCLGVDLAADIQAKKAEPVPFVMGYGFINDGANTPLFAAGRVHFRSRVQRVLGHAAIPRALRSHLFVQGSIIIVVECAFVIIVFNIYLYKPEIAPTILRCFASVALGNVASFVIGTLF